MRTATALAVLVAMCSPTPLEAQSPPAVNHQDLENAAVKYLRADAVLRQSYTLAPDAVAKLEKALASPLDGEDERLVAAAEDALVEFQHGAAIKRCDWTMSEEDGALANTAHRGAITELVAVSGLRARLRFRDGDTPGAMDDALAAMAATRHLSVDGSLASVLFGYKLERAITGVLARNLLRFSPAELNDLASGLGTLPSGFSLGTAFESEKVRRNELLAIAQDAKSRDELIERLLKKAPALRSNKENAFSCIPVDGGFRLESRLSEDGIPISLSIVPNSEERKASPRYVVPAISGGIP